MIINISLVPIISLWSRADTPHNGIKHHIQTGGSLAEIMQLIRVDFFPGMRLEQLVGRLNTYIILFPFLRRIPYMGVTREEISLLKQTLTPSREIQIDLLTIDQVL